MTGAVVWVVVAEAVLLGTKLVAVVVPVLVGVRVGVWVAGTGVEETVIVIPGVCEV